MKRVKVHEIGADGVDSVIGQVELRDGKLSVVPDELSEMLLEPLFVRGVEYEPSKDPEGFLDNLCRAYYGPYLSAEKVEVLP